MLFDRISSNIEILCFYGGIIVNTNNGITYNGGSNEFLTVILDMSLTEISWLLYKRIGWNLFKIQVEIIGKNAK